MKKLTLIFTLLFSTVMFSSPSYAEWKNVGKNDVGDTYYVDFDRIGKHDGYVYFWQLDDYLEPLQVAGKTFFSGRIFYKGECELLKYKRLSLTFYKGQMGTGAGWEVEGDKEWQYYPPNSLGKTKLKMVCSR